jgi:pimeloyl-ACP methyl ester carboxylesterase
LSFPILNAVICAEDVPFMATDARARWGGASPGTTIVDALARRGASWPRGVVDEDFKEPLVAATPALLLSGELDPVTPPDYAERVAEGLTNSVHLVGEEQGHGLVVVGCMPRVLRDFLAAPNPEALDAECLERERPMPFFITLLGPAP